MGTRAIQKDCGPPKVGVEKLERSWILLTKLQACEKTTKVETETLIWWFNGSTWRPKIEEAQFNSHLSLNPRDTFVVLLPRELQGLYFHIIKLGEQ